MCADDLTPLPCHSIYNSLHLDAIKANNLSYFYAVRFYGVFLFFLPYFKCGVGL
jgi:hypothetical protein